MSLKSSERDTVQYVSYKFAWKIAYKRLYIRENVIYFLFMYQVYNQNT